MKDVFLKEGSIEKTKKEKESEREQEIRDEEKALLEKEREKMIFEEQERIKKILQEIVINENELVCIFTDTKFIWIEKNIIHKY